MATCPFCGLGPAKAQEPNLTTRCSWLAPGKCLNFRILGEVSWCNFCFTIKGVWIALSLIPPPRPVHHGRPYQRLILEITWPPVSITGVQKVLHHIKVAILWRGLKCRPLWYIHIFYVCPPPPPPPPPKESIYIENKIEPRIDPCWVPHVNGAGEENFRHTV